ncbi:MAG: hypothetical protein ACI9IJ_002463, partial [Psychromonas sp.]
AINCVNPLAVDVNGYSLSDWGNATLVFELAPRGTRKTLPIFFVIKSLSRITTLQFYA